MQIEFNQPALISILKEHFSFNLARIKCLVLLIFALLEAKSVNLSKLKNFFTSKATPDARNKRLKRFLSQVEFVSDKLAVFLFKIMKIDEFEALTLILDRTNWKFGNKDCNILYLAVAYKGIAIPLFWSVLEEQKRGNSKAQNRIDLIQKFIDCFTKDRIAWIIGDREFIGKKWINWLQEKHIPFIMRIKDKGQLIGSNRGGTQKAEHLFADLKPAESKYLGIRKISETNAYKAEVTGLKLKNGEMLVLIHSKTSLDVCALYKSRWEIERFFKAIKTIGFDIEATNITNPKTLQTLLSVVSIAFCFMYKFGDVFVDVEKPKPKKHGYLPKSISLYGHEQLIEIIRQTFRISKDSFQKIFYLLEKTIFSLIFSFKLNFVP